MANCKFLRQKKQVKINGEWVDTRSYRYLPYCDGGTPGVRVRGGNPNGEVVVCMSANDGVIDTTKTISLDANGNGYLSLESNDIVAYVAIKNNVPSIGVAEISGCYTSIVGSFKCPPSTLKDIDELIVDCARYRRINASHCNSCFYFEGKKLTIKSLDTSNVTDMSCMFGSSQYVTSLEVSKFDTSKVTDMHWMFIGCSRLTSLDVSSFNTSKVTDMNGMFESCSNLTSLDVSNFNTGNVTDMDSMFSHCSSLTSLDLSHFNTINVTDMDRMFDECSGLTSLNLSNFNTSKVTTMYCMFYGCSSLQSLNVSHFNTNNVTNMSSMFNECSGLTSLNVSNFNTGNVTEMQEMFGNCDSLQSLNLSNFNTSKVTNMVGIFEGCDSLQTLDISGWDLTNASKRSMFVGCKRLNTIYMRNCSQTTIDKIKDELEYANISSQVKIIT